MSELNKNRYEVQKVISDTLKLGLAEYYGQNNGFGVMEFAQASFVNADRVILMHPVSARRVGFQALKYRTALAGIKRVDEWLEEQSWQLSVIIKKASSPSITDIQADDVASMLIVYLNGKGNEVLRSKGIAPLRIDMDSIIVYTDDSEIYQKRAVFTVKLQVPKEYTMAENELEQIKPNVKPV